MKLTKTHLILIGIFLLAFFTRLYSAAHVDIGSDEIIYSLIPLHIIDAARLSTVEQAPVYFYLTDLSYKLFGDMTLISTRFTSILFGATATLLIFLISFKIFNNKNAALLSSFLFALSGYAIRFNQEMDMTAYFLSLLSLYFFLYVLENKPKYLYPSLGILALASLVKPIVLLFAPAYFLTWTIVSWKNKEGLLYKKENNYHLDPKIIKTICISIMLCIIIVAPVLTYNYLLYKEKGMTDYYFTVLAGVGNAQIYKGQEAEPWTITKLKDVIFGTLTQFFKYDFIILIAGISGIFYAWKSKRNETMLLSVTIVFLYLYLAGIMGSSTHYVWVPLILSIFAGYGITHLTEKIHHKITLKKIIYTICIILLFTTSFTLHTISKLKENSIQNNLNEYAVDNLPKDAIIILDPRIYRGIYTWALSDKHYLEGTYFPELINNLDKLSGPKQTLPLYYIECGPGKYCGWKPEDYQRISEYGKQLSANLIPNMKQVKELQTADTLIIYQSTINAPLSIYEPIDRTHVHWYTPVGWKYTENAIDNYTPKTFFDKTLNSFSFIILYLDVLIALLTIPYVFYLLFKQKKEEENYTNI